MLNTLESDGITYNGCTQKISNVFTKTETYNFKEMSKDLKIPDYRKAKVDMIWKLSQNLEKHANIKMKYL